MLTEVAGEPGRWRQQSILHGEQWDADALCECGRDYVVETLAAENAVLVIEEIGFLTEGMASVCVALAGSTTRQLLRTQARGIPRHGVVQHTKVWRKHRRTVTDSHGLDARLNCPRC
jgi:SRSO17 transposase